MFSVTSVELVDGGKGSVVEVDAYCRFFSQFRSASELELPVRL